MINKAIKFVDTDPEELIDKSRIPLDDIILSCGIKKDLITDDVRHFTSVVESLIRLYAKKNHDYGNAFSASYGIFGHMYCISRIHDKISRLINIYKKGGPEVFDESGRDTLMDIACYAIMGLVELDKIPEPIPPY